jgi:hypothetical protein
LACGLASAPADASQATGRADIGPGPGSVATHRQGNSLSVRISPNSSRRWNVIDLAVSRRGAPVRRAAATVRFDMSAMSMGASRFRLAETRPGVYRYTGPAITMDGMWVLTFDVRPEHGRSFALTVRDQVRG